ncbi:MAG: hypothetical protein ACE5KP_04660 [Dehalococcoidales bacterium]
MKKWILALVICISIVALTAGTALASWGGGTGDDAVQVEGDVTLVDTKYSITGTLTALGTNSSATVLAAVGSGTWELDFGRQNYYLPTGFGVGTHTIQGKLCQGGEIDVYVVDSVSVGRAEGGPPPWHPKGGPPGRS